MKEKRTDYKKSVKQLKAEQNLNATERLQYEERLYEKDTEKA